MNLLRLLPCLLLAACQSQPVRDTVPDALPYYHTADFTPIWPESDAQRDTLHQLGTFRFTNQVGQTVSDDTFRGKIHVANFFFTSCPSLCPRTMVQLQRVAEAYASDPQVRIASYSVLPDRDSVAVLRTYADVHQIKTPQWHLLTGDREAVYTLARRSYFADKSLGVQKGEADFLHTENFILVDQNLHIRGIYNGTLPLDTEQLIADIRVLKGERGAIRRGMVLRHAHQRTGADLR